jgi:23S rRNA (uracil1939-C5)-methyltransferase
LGNAILAEVSIERLSKSGQGVGRYEGRSLFVEGALPGERVRVELAAGSKVLRGRLLEVLSPSAGRRPSPCPLSDRCGGCDWLHFDEEAQREAKLEIALSSLEHLAGIVRTELRVLPIRACKKQMGYRRRAVLHPHAGRLCLYGRHSHELVPIESCPALVPRLSALPGALGEKLSKLKDVKAVHLLAADESASFALFLTGPIRPSHLEVCERVVRELGLAGAVVVPEAGPARIIGEASLPDHLSLPDDPDSAPLWIRPDSFAQANSEANAELRASAVELLAARPPQRILELYCGNGNLTFAIAGSGVEVVAVDSSGPSLELARRRKGAAGRVRFIQGEVGRVGEALVSEGAAFEAMVADPPRGGAPGIGSLAQRLHCGRVVYVSCDPATLARDAQNLRSFGFTPDALQLIDMFPQTRHVEAVMTFARQATR